ncbi:low-density lipoprotein receptor-related protein 2-like [Penaeus chinensis]|uniref:low-density lipoprotein receptor-related protein 2-like n=1 Tax=Penaeus chinensis TaxID=139456 RepID=UPI001FB77532|nr:low-density lipoprotein receptor-related protein 2-like [Penaeus chinensis]
MLLSFECNANYSICDTNKCFHDLLKCDGEKDCKDGSDEAFCREPTERCAAGYTQCRTGTRCIPNSWRCDGEKDCPSGDDEENCSDCGSHFTCEDSKKCIPTSWKCDGVGDCNDGSDEFGCPIVTDLTCEEFTCDSETRCISNNWKCDGDIDCLDGRDEEGCPEVQSCHEDVGQLRCDNGTTCVDAEKVCDGSRDCEDGFDESRFCEKACQPGKCSHTCVKSPSGGVCRCPEGQVIDDLGTTCQVGIPPAFILVASSNKVEALSLDGSTNFTVYEGKKRENATIVAVAYDPVTDTVFWSVNQNGGIYKKPLRSPGVATYIINTDGKAVDGLAMDWLGRNLYMADSGRNRITVCGLNSVYCNTLVANVTAVRGIQVDPVNRKLIWSTWRSSKIEIANMDGSNRTLLVPDLRWPNAIATDPSKRRLYFLDAQTDTAEAINYDGTQRKQLVNANLKHPYAMALWANKLYYTDWISDQVWTCDKKDCGNRKQLTKWQQRTPYGIVLYHPDMFSEAENSCQEHTCCKLCLLSSSSENGYKCLFDDPRVCGETRKSKKLVVA